MESIEKALYTWYPEDHPLHLNLHHPLGKLVGEWGELLDDYMKHLYKPGFEWKLINELIDVWYYIRILAYQAKIELKPQPIFGTADVDEIIAHAISIASKQFETECHYKRHELYDLPCKLSVNIAAIGYVVTNSYSSLLHLCDRFDLTIDQLTDASWEKLKPGSVRGNEWTKEREL